MFQLLLFVFLNLYAISTAETETLTISQIIKRPPSGVKSNEYTGNQMRVHYAIETDSERGLTNVGPKYPKCHMNIGITISEAPEQLSVFATDVTENYCDFNVELGTEGGNIEFILALQNADDVVQVYTDIKLVIPVFPDGLDDVAMWVGKGNKDVALRIQDGSAADFTYESKSCKDDGSESTCYYVGVKKVTDKPISLCKKVTPTKSQTRVAVQDIINVCDETQVVADATTDNVFENGVVPDQAEISYTKTGNADVMITRGTDEFELVVYTKTGGDIDTTSVTICLTATCNVKHTSPDATYTIMMIGKATGKTIVKDSTVHALDDYEVIGSPLSTNLIEARWIHQDDMYNKYHVARDKKGVEDTSFIATTVSCDNELGAENFHCFGYFTGLTADTSYKLSVQITDVAGTNHNATNTVTLTGTKTNAGKFATSTGMNMKISSLDTKWHKGLRSFEVNACVHHAEASNLSSYQAILINKLGQWKKVTGITNIVGSELCFDALHVDIYNFDLSEDLTLVAVKRGHNNITVLESAQTIIYI